MKRGWGPGQSAWYLVRPSLQRQVLKKFWLKVLDIRWCWTKWSEQSGLNMQRRGLWGLVVVWLSWLSGRALAAQARCLGFDSWQLPAFSLSSILPQILFNSLMGLTFKYNDDIPHMHASRGIYQSASQSCNYQKMTQTDNVNLVHVYLKLYDNLCSKGIWSLWVVPIPRQQNLGMS